MEDSLSLKKKVYLNSYTTLSAESESLMRADHRLSGRKCPSHAEHRFTETPHELIMHLIFQTNLNRKNTCYDKWEEDYKRAVTRCGEIYCRIENME